jgi:hypothetical protein
VVAVAAGAVIGSALGLPSGVVSISPQPQGVRTSTGVAGDVKIAVTSWRGADTTGSAVAPTSSDAPSKTSIASQRRPRCRHRPTSRGPAGVGRSGVARPENLMHRA